MIQRILKVILILTLVFSLFFTYFNLSYKNKILPNIYISGLNVSGLTKEEAKEKIKILVPTNKNITLSSNEKDYIYNSNYFKFDYDLEETVKKAYLIGRDDTFFNNQRRKFQSLFIPLEVIFSYKFDNSLIDLEISRIVGEEQKSGRDASFKEVYGVLSIQDEKEGISVDYDKLKIILEKELPKTKDSKIQIPYYQRKPEVTAADFWAATATFLARI